VLGWGRESSGTVGLRSRWAWRRRNPKAWGWGRERGEIFWVEEEEDEACGASGIGLRVKLYFYCTVQTRTVQTQPQNGLSNTFLKINITIFYRNEASVVLVVTSF
jgi:hypothetical protein